MGMYHIIIKNENGAMIENNYILASSATQALEIYIRENKPILEKGDTIEVK